LFRKIVHSVESPHELDSEFVCDFYSTGVLCSVIRPCTAKLFDNAISLTPQFPLQPKKLRLV